MRADLAIGLPMWLSFGFTIFGAIISIMLARLAYGSVLFVFTLLLTVGITVFAGHHLLEIFGFQAELLSVGLEALSSALFLAAAVYLGYRARKIIYR